MKKSYDNIKCKDVVDFLVSIDLDKARKHAVWNHYRRDFFSILKRKLHLSK